MSNNSTPVLTEEDLASGFFVDDKWYPIGLIWLPSVVLGLPANALVIILGKWCEPLYQYGVYASYGLSVLLSVLLFIHLYRSFRKVHVNGQRRRLRDEVAILAGIILQILVPLTLTVPSKGKSILRAIGINLQVDKDIFQAIYNYNPLCDAIFVFIFVKPYRRAFLRLAHLGVRESTIINLPGFRTNRIAVQVISSGHT
uniref:Uncharacterized protein n=1 Tax=Plectus sambesii TaxID=2011161 RepID=A0A914WI32_9BILA